MTDNTIGYVVLAAAAIAAAVVVFVVVTDGRYFGKPLVRWIYDRMGPAIFSVQVDQSTWSVLFAELEMKAGDRFLDIGTATGDLPISLAAMAVTAIQAIGLEISMPMVKTAVGSARRRGVAARTGFVTADVEAPLPFADRAFGCVTALGVLETLRQSGSSLRELNRVLRPGGVLVLSVYTGPSRWLASLGEGWYREQLSAIGPYDFRRAPLRRSHDVLIARKANSIEGPGRTRKRALG